jgi:sortase (surface protein transpeptidase)
LTLFTCANFDEKASTYRQRLVVKAILVGTQTDRSSSSGQ